MKAIAAMSSNRVIGNRGVIPWKIPKDMKFFKEMTMDQTIVVGYNTYTSLPILEKRNVLVLTHRTKSFISEEEMQRWNQKCSTISIINDICEIPEDSWICGGQNLYSSTLDVLCSDLYLTTVKHHYDGDRFFPFIFNFKLSSVIENNPEFKIEHYIRK